MQNLLSLPIEAWLGALALVFFLGLIAFIVAAAYVVQSYRTLRGDAVKHEITPQPFEIKAAAEFATKKDFENGLELLGKHELKDEESFRRIYTKIDGVRDGLDVKLDAQTRNLTEQITNMPDRIIATLATLKVLKTPSQD